MQDEARLLLHDFVSEPQNYMAILRAIAQGDRQQKAIATATGLPQGHVSKYLSTLRETGFVERRLSLTAAPNSRGGRYHISDPYLRFHFRFLSRRQAQLALGVTEQAVTEVKRHLIDFIGTHNWEELCREWLLRSGCDQVGSIWSRQVQIDVAAIDSMAKTICLGECKWNSQKVGRAVLTHLLERVEKAIPGQKTWELHLLGFARAGWTDAAQEFAKATRPQGENWNCSRFELVDLARLDKDLANWSN